jgi:DNA-binding XRE family transcriptional regulator
MSPIEHISQCLKKDFPELETEVRKADAPRGFCFLNARSGDFEIAVEWKPDFDIGVSAFDASSHPLDGLYAASDEWYTSPEAAYHRIASLLIERRKTRPVALSIPQVRHERGLSQEALSRHLEVTQASYSKLERRGNITVATLKKVIQAMGGSLRIQAIFPDTHDVREVTFR